MEASPLSAWAVQRGRETVCGERFLSEALDEAIKLAARERGTGFTVKNLATGKELGTVSVSKAADKHRERKEITQFLKACVQAI